ncbi:hypothetical protein SJH87_11415 [Staphylococcus sp. GCP4]|nr:hypothetical protein [Staphylococcus sp. GCP4]
MPQAFITYNQSMIELKIHTNIKPFFTRGWGPTKRISPRNSTSKASWGGPTKRISPRNLTSKASWGIGPNKENFNVISTSLTPLFD